VQRYLRRVLGSSDEAEEATQQVMVQLLGALPSYRQEGVPFRSFVYRLAHNHAQDRQAARVRLRVADPSEMTRMRDSDDSAAAPDSSVEARDALTTLIAPLPALQQQVLRLIYQHDLTPRQVGTVLDCSSACVRQLHKRARDSLREIVEIQTG
jgi:RNA polymerase sigma-70 factor (ECF subfamily)